MTGTGRVNVVIGMIFVVACFAALVYMKNKPAGARPFFSHGVPSDVGWKWRTSTFVVRDTRVFYDANAGLVVIAMDLTDRLIATPKSAHVLKDGASIDIPVNSTNTIFVVTKGGRLDSFPSRVSLSQVLQTFAGQNTTAAQMFGAIVDSASDPENLRELLKDVSPG